MNKQLWSTSYVLFMAGTCGTSPRRLPALCMLRCTVASLTVLAGGRRRSWSHAVLHLDGLRGGGGSHGRAGLQADPLAAGPAACHGPERDSVVLLARPSRSPDQYAYPANAALNAQTAS